ncbi:T9SS type B sorting domain-containing protein [Luteibaculum oceani]|uniref:T9SS type B sorting domain-containing protein n=1 Tax=Luteibaculum oceani TaxID=1294296 RepID=A0A5C6VPM7_9FLAO|nr:gliding motility-associated C-terminal domain-containing protein [Luteibaculum oceani]TXC85228.1 T9SS type B sorting domain-containing protein [Luteibaculum oceani]
MFKPHYFTLLIFILCYSVTYGQTPYPGCPNVSGIPTDSTLLAGLDTVVTECGVKCVDLEASVLKTGATNTYKVESVPYAPPFSFSGGNALFVGSDDIFSGLINLPFDFCFYGNTFSQLVVGANGCISFNAGYANGNCCWAHDENIPSNNNPTCPIGVNTGGGLYRNSINGAFHDLDPSVGNPDINYSVLGSYPCRTFVVNFKDVPHFSCNNLRTTQQIVLYETTNVIEVYIKDKPRCSGWNGGRATIGIQNGAGNQGIAPPGRNTGSWVASNEGWRFTPNGNPNYEITWTDHFGQVIGNSEKINYCQSDAGQVEEKVYVEIDYEICNGDVINVKDSLVVIFREQVNAIAQTKHILCADSCNGVANISANAGTAPFTFSWNNGSTAAFDSSLCQGNYTVTVTDKYGCEDDINFDIQEPDPIRIEFEKEDVSCFGGTDGMATSILSGGVGNYNSTWTPGGSTNDTIFVGAGTYVLTVGDDQGCLMKDSVKIEQPELLEITVDAFLDLSCLENQDGEINVSATGGTPGYEFSINNQPFTSNGSFTGLDTGLYTITVRDDNGCEASVNQQLNADSVSVIAPPDTLLCLGSEFTLTADGYFTGVTWNNEVIDGFKFTVNDSGTFEYIVTAENLGGCLAYDTTIIQVEPIYDATIQPAGPYCTNQKDDTLVVARKGGIWSGTGVNAEGIFSPGSVNPGNYWIKYRFDKLCPSADSIEIAVNSEFDAAINDPGYICVLDDPFKLTSVTPGGNWYGPGIADTNFSTFDPGLAGAGNHKIYHLIDNECGDYDSLIITVAGSIQGSVNATPSFCPEGNMQQLTGSPGGGKWKPMSYIDSAGNFTPTAVGSGAYPVYYMAPGACVQYDTGWVTVVDTLKALADWDSLLCNGGSNGSLTTVVIGGSGSGHTFNWNPGGSLPGTRNNLSAGSYGVQVSDDLGCSASVTHQVFEPNAISETQTASSSNPSCGNYTDGWIEVFPAGGIPFNYGYNLSISPSTGTVSGHRVNNLGPGTYTITVTDKNGCNYATQPITLTAPPAIVFNGNQIPENCDKSNGKIIISNINGGTPPFNFLWDQSPAPDTSLLNSTAGSYLFSIVDAQGCQVDSTFTIKNIPSPSISLSKTDISCYNAKDGTATVTINSGVAPLDILWSIGATSNQISNLDQGTVSVNVSDSAGCNSSANIFINQPSALILQPILDTTICDGQTLRLKLNSAGGFGNITYQLNGTNLPSDSLIINSAGSYTLGAFDDKGCTAENISFVLNYSPPLTTTVSAPDSVCFGEGVFVNSTASGGNGNYIYQWSNGATGASTQFFPDTSLNGESITLTLTDNCSTPKSASKTVWFYKKPAFNPTLSPIKGCSPLLTQYNIPNNTFSDIQWIVGSAIRLSGNTSFNHIIYSPGNYPVSAHVQNSAGCPFSYNLDTLEVYPIPDAEIVVDPTRLTTTNSLATFTLNYLNTPLSNVIWTLSRYYGEKDTVFVRSALDKISYKFPPDTGVYRISAELFSKFQCTSFASLIFKVEPEHLIYVPEAFTPNGDGVNETFSISSDYIREGSFSIKIFNRWGELIFSSKDPNFQWDGSYLGNPVPIGTYVWHIEFYSESHRNQTLTGKVTVIH